MRLTVAGTAMRGSGYPNACNTLRILRDHAGWEIDDQAKWLPEGKALWTVASGSRLSLMLSLARLLLANLGSALRLLSSAGSRRGWTYAPYPSIFLLWWLSWLPRGIRPRVVADAYISIWDAAFRDRGFGPERGAASRLMKWFEGRALRAAALVFVDTVANRDWMHEDFRIPLERLRAVPLAIDERVFDGPVQRAAAPGNEVTRVLYLGTLVPLHGIQVIVQAAEKLSPAMGLAFDFVGDGRDAELIRPLVEPPRPRVTWSRRWHSEREAARLLQQADISLGVFGGAGKASRVLPFKVYLSLAAGTPVVTQHGHSLPEGVPPPPLVQVVPTAQALADALQALAADPSRREDLACRSRGYYDEYLGPRAVAAAWTKCVRDRAGSAQG